VEAHAAQHATSPRAGLRLPGVGAGLGRGLVVLYLSVLVLLPLAALADKSLSEGLSNFWDQVTAPGAINSLELTVIASLIVVIVNGFFGTILAWLLVRDEFPGKGIVNAVIDLPFALPTIVASLILIELWGKQSPLGIDISLSRTAVVVALPGLAAGVALAFARALGEFGSVLLFAGGLADTQVSSVYIKQLIETGNEAGAAAVSVVLLLCSLLCLLVVSLIQRWSSRHERSTSSLTNMPMSGFGSAHEYEDDERE